MKPILCILILALAYFAMVQAVPIIETKITEYHDGQYEWPYGK